MIESPPKIKKIGQILFRIVTDKKSKVNNEKIPPIIMSKMLKENNFASFLIKNSGKKETPVIIIKKGHILIIYR